MIAQLLNRDFVLDQARALLEGPGETLRGSSTRLPISVLEQVTGEAEEIGPEELAEAGAVLRESLASEAVESSGQPGFDVEAADRRGEEPSPIDDTVFISRDPVLSNFQSALELTLLEQDSDRLEALEPENERRGGGEEAAVTDLSIAGVDAERRSDGRRVFDKFSVLDPGWVSSLLAMGIRKFRKRVPFPTVSPPTRQIADSARVVLFGDWGSGVPRARKVASQIRREIVEAKSRGREVHAIHLGDVYYSGWRYEYERRFLKYWPVEPSEASQVGSWTLNGNHDMYSGGHAYFRTALAEPRFAPYHQGSSYFRLTNRHWQMLGLDSAYDDHGLADPQAAWVESSLRSSRSEGRRSVLLSHHQIFSSYEGGPTSALRRRIGPALATGLVYSWFWGHEHRLVLFDPYDFVQKARCVGHGGVPVYMTHGKDPVPYPGIWEFRDSFRHGLERWTLFGFAVLDFENEHALVRYIDEDGNETRQEAL